MSRTASRIARCSSDSAYMGKSFMRRILGTARLRRRPGNGEAAGAPRDADRFVMEPEVSDLLLDDLDGLRHLVGVAVAEVLHRHLLVRPLGQLGLQDRDALRVQRDLA